MSQEKLFSVTLADCEVQTFQSGGKGGQHQNHSNTGVRIIHRPSGARGESREHRSQLQNKRAAFDRMARSLEMRKWIAQECLIRSGLPTPEEQVRKSMTPDNLRVEIKDENGRWVVGDVQPEEPR